MQAIPASKAGVALRGDSMPQTLGKRFAFVLSNYLKFAYCTTD